MKGVWVTCILAAILLVPATQAEACSRNPRASSVRPASQAAIDQAARQVFGNAEFVAQVTVLRSPRFRTNRDNGPPPPGLLRVDAVIKGAPPRTISLPLADPCLLYFQRVGERL